MTAPRTDELAEREVDLSRWRASLVALWWLPVLGLVLGAIVGVLFSFHGGTSYKASSLISLGQPGQSRRCRDRGLRDQPASRLADRQLGFGAGAGGAHRRDAVRRAARQGVGRAGRVGGRRGRTPTPLISLTVQGAQARKTQAAANALSRRVVALTTAPYVGTKIATYTQVLNTTNSQLASISIRLAALNKAIKDSNLAPLDQLVLISQIDNAEQRQGNLYDQKATTQQQLAFAKNVESAKVITAARSQKASAHSRRSSLLVGALIGLMLGAAAAIVVDPRGRRAA